MTLPDHQVAGASWMHSEENNMEFGMIGAGTLSRAVAGLASVDNDGSAAR